MKRLYFDAETSPNVGTFWKAGYKQQIHYKNIIKERQLICVSYKWHNKDEVHTLDWGKKQCDKDLIKKFWKVIEKADEIIAHNGDRFDIKWLRTRAAFHRLPFPAQLNSVDTLKQARGNFYFNSNRLDYIGDFLGVGHKLETSSGLWTRVCAGDQDALKEMIEYCEEDVRLLQRVHEIFVNYTPQKTNFAVLAGGAKWQCPECGSVKVACNKTRTTAAGTIKCEYKCNDCRKHYTISNKSRMDHLQWKMLNGVR